MPVHPPENVACRQFGDWLKVDWSYVPLVSGDTLAGFKVKWGNGVLPVPWTIPPAVDAGLRGGDGGSPREFYSLLLRISDGFICDWESFETYPLGVAGVLGDNIGNQWDGAAVVGENYIRTVAREDFESYEIGTVAAPLNQGMGWNGPAVMGNF